MNLTRQVEKLRKEFPVRSPNPQAGTGGVLATERGRLSEFYESMKAKGLVKTPTYDLPQTDTIGRNLVWRQVLEVVDDKKK